ncbi:WD40 repeat-containing protein [Heterostelium album PN500]|uniref:WD40 repeat-containing protein n=1 Tax=Heterostelium pallidum (strain ATCC 26659 / Pp 5 / PN500) TaxID=670386 RepID=D3AXW5_HETP5|nr:WD40 repeat-containing protein [Heterostelium album PN500]EFA85792.1 WD40 repeat-containing protein [Heterostelium album PN500]|eukprot:XP_020437898.1 WD40 repeat-containing protein [Heterostelium album PN500]
MNGSNNINNNEKLSVNNNINNSNGNIGNPSVTPQKQQQQQQQEANNTQTTTTTSTTSNSNTTTTTATTTSTATSTTTTNSSGVGHNTKISTGGLNNAMHRDIMLPVVLWCGAPTHRITAILITPDKRTIITGSQAGHLVISSVYLDSQPKENQFIPRVFTMGHNGVSVTCLAMCEVEGREAFVSCGADGSISVWSISDGYCLVASQPSFLTCSPSFMVTLPNKRRVAVVGKGSNSIFIVDVQTLKIIATLTSHIDWVSCLFTCTISQDQSPLLLSASLDGTIKFWSLNDGEYDYSLQTICLTPGGEGHCSPNDAPIAIEFSPNGKSLLVISKDHWSIFTTNNSYKLCSIKCPNPQGWFGGSFVNNSMILVWTKDGKSFLYKMDPFDGKSFSMGHPVPLPGTSPLNLPKPIDITSSSPGIMFNDSIEISHLAPETNPPTLLLSFANYDTTSKYPFNANGGVNSSTSNLQNNNNNNNNNNSDITKKIGAAMLWSNVFLVGDSFGRVKIWVIPVDDIPVHSMRKMVREPNLIGNIADGWRGCDVKNKSRVTASLVLEDSMMLIRGYEDGSISTSKLPIDLHTKFHPGSHQGKVNCLMSSPTSGNSKRRLFSASNDTTIKVWDLTSFQLLHTFSHHTGPVTSIFTLPHAGRSNFLSISEDKTVGMYSTEDLSCKHMFGVHSSPLSRVFWKPEQGYLVVETIDGSVSLWEIGSGELEGVVYGQIAKDIIDHAQPLSNNNYQPKDLGLYDSKQTTQSFVFTHKNDPPIQTIFLNIKAISDEILKYTEMNTKYNTSFPSNMSSQSLSSSLGNIENQQQQQQSSAILLVQKELSQLVSIFSYLMPWGMERNLDSMFMKDFQLRPPQPDFSFGVIGEGGNLSILTPQASSFSGKMQCSEYLTAQTTLSAVALSRTILRIGGLENACSQISTYYCIILPDTLTNYVYPDFSYLASYCQDNSEDIMFSARSVFKTAIERMPKPQFLSLIDFYSQLLKSDSLGSVERARAVIVLAKIASHRKEDVPQNLSLKIGYELLKMIFKGKGHLTIAAVELIGKGFTLWKDSVKDIPGLLKCLFTLTMQNDTLGTTAINSLLLIGTVDVMKFIQTIGDEISNESKNLSSTIHAIVLIGLLIKNNPDSVLTYLPRVIDCIIKSLDPHIPAFREACLKQTTAVLHLMVNKYPMVSFHHESQRLMLGTMDGSIVIYDLKTATRWHRLEGHERALISAVSFSESGKALASFSTKDNLLKIFQTNSSFFGFLGSQFNCTKSVRITTDHQQQQQQQQQYNPAPKVENIKIQWLSPQQILLKKDNNTFTLNLDSAH